MQYLKMLKKLFVFSFLLSEVLQYLFKPFNFDVERNQTRYISYGNTHTKVNKVIVTSIDIPVSV